MNGVKGTIQVRKLIRASREAFKIICAYLIFLTVRFALKVTNRRIRDINPFEWRVYSQNGEDGILNMIFCKIGVTNKFCVEIGAGDGLECNSRWLIKREGWHYLHLDSKDDNPLSIKKEFITAKDIEQIFRKYSVQKEFDLLSIDIDYNTYYIWKALDNYFPRVVVVEYNSSIPLTESKAVIYNEDGIWDGTDYFGASLLAFVKLGISKGYTLLGCEKKGVNAFFIKDGLIKGNFSVRSIDELYRPPSWGKYINGRYTGHPPSNKAFVDV